MAAARQRLAAGQPDLTGMVIVECQGCGKSLGQAADAPSGALCFGCAMPRCHRCSAPGEVPIRPHGVALCSACYRTELNTTVELEPA